MMRGTPASLGQGKGERGREGGRERERGREREGKGEEGREGEGEGEGGRGGDGERGIEGGKGVGYTHSITPHE